MRAADPRPVVVSASTGAAAVGREAGTRTWTLVFDGDCGFCRRCVALLAKWDRVGRLVYVPFQDAAALERLPPLDRHALEQAMHLVTPERMVYAGAAALPPILRIVPFGWTLAWTFRVPGVPWLAAKVYRQVARNRHRLGCGSRTCSLGR